MTLVAARKPHHSHRKRNGRHQHKHKDFAKTYWPYLPLLLIVGLGLMLNSLWPTHRSVLGYATDMSASELFSGTNSQRQADGEATLTMNSLLAKAAQAKANDMAAKDYWSHNSPTGETPWDFITAAGYDYQTAGENLAYGFDSASATITGWMNSPEHRANILNTSYTNVGFGIVNIPNYQNSGPETLVVAMYASPAPKVIARTPAPVQSAPLPASTQPTSSPSLTQTGELKQPVKSTPAPAKQPVTAHKSDTVTPAKPSASEEPPAQNISRIQLVSNGEAAWSLMATLAVVTILLALLIVRHGYAWHKMLNRSERFVLHHPLLDIAAVAFVTLGIILSHSAGVIR